jgi:hypothetical protein
MFDSVFFRLTQTEVGEVDFLAETPCFLEDVAEHTFENGLTTITGKLGGLKVSLNRYQVKVKDGSLCKWYLGNNYQTMGRGDTERSIEKLSDTLHLPMSKAIVYRLDIAQNFICKYPPEVYMNHLGVLKYADRLQEPNGIYYRQTDGRLCFYDKNREQKSKREPVPELYEGKNVLRYEQRYTKHLAKRLNVPEVTGGLLYNEVFYIDVLNQWRDTYRAIKKINDCTFNFQAMKTRQQLYRMGVLSLIEKAGGQVEMIAQISEAQKRGELTKKQAFDLRQTIIDVSKAREGLTVPSDAIQELDKKVGEAVMFYR